MSELKNCPFCGGKVREPLTKQWTNCIGDESWSASITCDSCELKINPRELYETKAKAVAALIERWNTRAAHGMLTAEQVRDAIERHSAWVIGNNRCFHNGAYEAIADELNAELGSGTCEMVTSGTPCEGNTDKACTKCGAYNIGEFYDGDCHRSTPNYCPNCGRKVVEQ